MELLGGRWCLSMAVGLVPWHTEGRWLHLIRERSQIGKESGTFPTLLYSYIRAIHGKIYRKEPPHAKKASYWPVFAMGWEGKGIGV
jgi:hypothetical protein